MFGARPYTDKMLILSCFLIILKICSSNGYQPVTYLLATVCQGVHLRTWMPECLRALEVNEMKNFVKNENILFSYSRYKYLGIIYRVWWCIIIHQFSLSHKNFEVRQFRMIIFGKVDCVDLPCYGLDSINIQVKWSFSCHYYQMCMIQWNLSITTTKLGTSLPYGAHLGGQGPPRWAPEGRNC